MKNLTNQKTIILALIAIALGYVIFSGLTSQFRTQSAPLIPIELQANMALNDLLDKIEDNFRPYMIKVPDEVWLRVRENQQNKIPEIINHFKQIEANKESLSLAEVYERSEKYGRGIGEGITANLMMEIVSREIMTQEEFLKLAEQIK